MAANLRTKLPSSDTLVIYDINDTATSSFTKEHKGVEVAQSVREIAEKAVSGQSSEDTLLVGY